MDKKLAKAINDQIKNELHSAYIYLSMAAYFEMQNLEGFAHWMKVQFKEEQGHAMKLFEFMNDRGTEVTLQAIPQPPTEFSSAEDVFKMTLDHEKKITGLLEKLQDTAKDVNDHSAVILLNWFITEQVEEEKNAARILDTIKTLKGNAVAMIMLDRELAKRGS